MKKHLILFTFLLSSTYYLQTTASNINKIILTDPLYQHWQLTSVIVDGTATEPGAVMVDDIIYINEDNSIQTILSGISLNGTWTIDQSNTLLSITSTDMNSFLRLRILEITDTSLKVQMVNNDGVVTILLFEPE